MVPNSSATGSFVDASFGLRYHSDSAHLRRHEDSGRRQGHGGHHGSIIPASSLNDSNVNPHNPIYGIYQTARAARCST